MNRSIKVIEHSDDYDQYYSFADMDDGIKHHGVLDQKWGVRKYQNEDGSLTPAGRAHYGVGPARKKHEGPIAKAKRVYKQNRDEIKKHGFVSWLNGEHDESAQKWKREYEKEHGKSSEQNNRQKQVDEMNKGSEYIKTTYDPDKNEYTHTIDMSKFLNDAGKIDENKVRDFAQKNPDMLRSMYQQDKKNGVIGSLDSNTQKVLEDKLGDKSNSSSDSNQPEWEKRAKEYGYSSAEDLVKQQYKHDFDEKTYGEALSSIADAYANDPQGGDMVNDFVKSYGLTKYDLAYDHDGYIARKDGKYFVLKDEKGKKHNYAHLDEAFADYHRLNLEPDEDAWNSHDSSKQQREESNARAAKSQQNRVQQMKKSGMTVEQIAKKLHIPPGTVSSYLYS